MYAIRSYYAAPDDALRQGECQPNLLHMGPSRAMLSDALAQFLVSRKWREVLLSYNFV